MEPKVSLFPPASWWGRKHMARHALTHPPGRFEPHARIGWWLGPSDYTDRQFGAGLRPVRWMRYMTMTEGAVVRRAEPKNLAGQDGEVELVLGARSNVGPPALIERGPTPACRVAVRSHDAAGVSPTHHQFAVTRSNRRHISPCSVYRILTVACLRHGCAPAVPRYL